MGRRTRMFLLKPNSNQGWGLFETKLLRLHGSLAQREHEKVQPEFAYRSASWKKPRSIDSLKFSRLSPMILNREAETTGSICIALLRRITFKVEVVNEVRLL
jgi:hypothetical protein